MNNNYFLIIPPGLEQIALEELTSKTDLTGVIQAGGIELQGDHQAILNLNATLKIPSRILWRISHFRCRDFPKLFNKTQKIEWNRALTSLNLKVQSSSTNSRLFDSRKIEKSLLQGIAAYHKKNTPPKRILENSKEQRVYLRFVDDNVTISVDTSGEHLHLRGYRTFIGDAPLRENLAAACAFAFKKHLSSSHTIIDPMCGSGSLLSELRMIDSPSPRDDFHYPVIKHASNYLSNTMIGLDIDSKTVAAAKENSKQSNTDIDFKVEDLFEEKKWEGSPTALLSNLPYGIRIKSKYTSEEICKQMINKFQPDILGVIIPRSEKLNLKNYDLKSSLDFSNGGIDVSFHIFINCSSN